MPTINVSRKELDSLVGRKLELNKLKELLLLYLKADLENISGDELSIKLEDTNRPDLWSAEGLARNLRNLLGMASGFKLYRTETTGLVVNVDQTVEKVRPFIACAIARKVILNDAMVKSLMQMQEKLDSNYGRKRKKTSIGFYDLDKIAFPVLYTTASPDDVRFVPLGFAEELSLREIIEKHPKGIEYGRILKGAKEWPLLIDSRSNVLSFPPIINSNDLGQITSKTRNLLIEVTGTDQQTVNNVLGIIAIALSDHGARLGSVEITYKNSKQRTPDLKPIEFVFKPSFAKKLLGIDLSERQTRKILEKMGYEVVDINRTEDRAVLKAAFYRKDIMHDVDVVEDIAIGYGYNTFEPRPPQVATEGGLQQSTMRTNLVREMMIGLGHQEIMSFMLTNKETMFTKMEQKEQPVVELENPVSATYSILRNSLLPGVINFLAINKTVEFPQKIFEIGDIVSPNPKTENRADQSTRLCAALTHSRATFTEMKSVLDKLLHDLGVKFSIRSVKDSSFIDGRVGEIVMDEKVIGILGELHPKVLENFGLENPVIVFELGLEGI